MTNHEEDSGKDLTSVKHVDDVDKVLHCFFFFLAFLTAPVAPGNSAESLLRRLRESADVHLGHTGGVRVGLGRARVQIQGSG